MIRLRELTHRYPDGRIALDRLTLDVAPGERLALLGPNGAGKTTLLLRLCGVYLGAAGQVEIDGLDPAKPGDRRQLPRRVGLVFQNPDDQLFGSTVLDDVAFGPLNLGLNETEATGAALEALESVGLKGAGERSPHRLSGGEKRRAALAGVLAMKPSILLLDEPSMFLDPRGRRELIRILNGWPGTLIVATHDLDLACDVAGRAVILDGGAIHADGAIAAILANEALMDAHGLDVPARHRGVN